MKAGGLIKKVEVLCLFPCSPQECEAAVTQVKAALAELSLAAEVRFVRLGEEAGVPRPKSCPTIRVDEADLFTDLLVTEGTARCWIYSKAAVRKGILRRLLLGMVGGWKRG